jgi:hypothetical protein
MEEINNCFTKSDHIEVGTGWDTKFNHGFSRIRRIKTGTDYPRRIPALTVGFLGIPAGTLSIDNPVAKAAAKDAKAPWVAISAFTSRKTAGLLALRGSPMNRAEEVLLWGIQARAVTFMFIYR